jgi:hypothetical protein
MRFIVVVVLDVMILLARIILWFRKVLFWFGIVVLVATAMNLAMVPRWRMALIGLVGSLVMIAISRAGLLLDDRLHVWQVQLHAWAQGWPVRRYLLTVLPPRR